MPDSPDAPAPVVIWTLRRGRGDVACLFVKHPGCVEAQIFQDRDIVLRERFPDAEFAGEWADRLRQRLEAQGWAEPGAKREN